MSRSIVIENVNRIHADLLRQLSSARINHGCASGATALKKWLDRYVQGIDGETVDLWELLQRVPQMITDLQLDRAQRAGASAFGLALGKIADDSVRIAKVDGTKLAEVLQQRARRAAREAWNEMQQLGAVRLGIERLRQGTATVTGLQTPPPQDQVVRNVDMSGYTGY